MERQPSQRQPSQRQPSNQPIDEEVHSVPLDTSEGEVVVPQENTGRDNMAGSGEWPDPKSPPRGPAPGTVDEDRERIERSRHRDGDREPDQDRHGQVADTGAISE